MLSNVSVVLIDFFPKNRMELLGMTSLYENNKKSMHVTNVKYSFTLL